MPTWTAVILTGGRSSRMGQDKSAALVGGVPLLDRVLAAVPGECPVVIVGPESGLAAIRDSGGGARALGGAGLIQVDAGDLNTTAGSGQVTRVASDLVAPVEPANHLAAEAGGPPAGGLPGGPRRVVRWTREDPPGGGPAAALLAGANLVETPVLVALATDLPFLAELPSILASRLAAAPSGDVAGGVDAGGRLYPSGGVDEGGRLDASGGVDGGHWVDEGGEVDPGGGDNPVDGVVAVDLTGRDQPLCAAYRTSAVLAAGRRLGDPQGASMRSLLAGMRLMRLRPDVATLDPTLDVDTPAELDRARGALMMQEWAEALRRELATPDEVDVDLVLGIARDAAHHVMRPAAPVATFVLGVAVGSGMPLEEAASRIRQLAEGWPSASPDA